MPSVKSSYPTASKWTPVSEKMPPMNDLVLVIHDGRKITKQAPTEPMIGFGYWNGYASDKSKKWCVCKDRYYMYFGCLWPDADSIATWGEVTHWQPLPEVPRV